MVLQSRTEKNKIWTGLQDRQDLMVTEINDVNHEGHEDREGKKRKNNHGSRWSTQDSCH